MALYFRCPCGIILDSADGSAGKGGACPVCGKIVIVPAEAVAVAADEIKPAAPAQDAASAPEAPAPVEPEPTEAPAPQEAPAAAEPELAPPAARACPGCGGMLEPNAVLCVQCGYNLQTGERVSAAVEPGPAAPEGAPELGAAPVGVETDAAPAELPAPEIGPGPGDPGMLEEPEELRSAALQSLAELDDFAGEPDGRQRRGRARPAAKKGGLLGKLILVFLVLVLLAAGGLAGVVVYAPQHLPDWVRTTLKSYGIIKPGRTQ